MNEDHLIATKTYEYSDEWLDQLESYVTMDSVVHEFTYDDQGNPLTITNFDFSGTSYVHANLTWFGRQLTSISVVDEYDQTQASISYSYNDQGYRTKMVITVGSTVETFLYELLNSTVYYETYTNSSNSGMNYELSYLLDSGNEIIGFVYNGDAYYYLKDIQGNILSVVDNEGTIQVQYEYDAYGNLINSPAGTIAQINPYTYRGYRWDSEISMFYLNSRFYNPEMSRFISSDGLLGVSGDIQSTNMYAYCVNNPVMFSDPTGFLGWTKYVGWEAWQEISNLFADALGWASLSVAMIKAMLAGLATFETVVGAIVALLAALGLSCTLASAGWNFAIAIGAVILTSLYGGFQAKTYGWFGHGWSIIKKL